MKSIGRIIAVIQADERFSEEQKQSMCDELLSLTKPLETDSWIYRLVVFFLGVAILATVAGGIFLTYTTGGNANYQLPQGIVAIGSAAVGALAGLLAPSPKNGG